jgi:tetratricopeptide (TPR) repeat protein
LGDLLRDRDPKRALTVLDLGIQRLSEAGNSVNIRRAHASLLAKSSYPLRRLGRRDEAGARIDAALALLKDTKDYPSQTIKLSSETWTIICALADHQAAMGNPHEGLATYEQLLDAVMATKPEALADLRDAPKLSRIYVGMAVLYGRTGDRAKMAALNSRRLELWSHWQQALPRNSFVLRQVEAARQSSAATKS